MTEDMTLAEEAQRLAADCRREAELVWTGAWHLPGNEYMNEHAQRLTHVASVLELVAAGTPLDYRRFPQTDLTAPQEAIDGFVGRLAQASIQAVYR